MKHINYLTAVVLFTSSAFVVADDNSVDKAQNDKDDSPIETVVVVGKHAGDYTIITEDTQKLVKMPGALGDPLGAITALPGVITPAQGGEPAVRGSSPSDNRYFIDGMPAAYIFHQFNTSIIDENIIQDFQLYSAGFGANYSNATGAIFDIRLRDPEKKDFSTTVTASLLRAGVLFESQVTENSAFYLSARQGLMQFFLPEDDEPDEDGIRIQSAPADSDYVAKYLWENDAKQRISVNFIGATDDAEAELTDRFSAVEENPDFIGNAKIKDKFDGQSISFETPLASGALFNLLAAHNRSRGLFSWADGDYFQDLTSNNIQVKGRGLIPVAERHTLNIGAELDEIRYDYKTRQPLFVCTDLDTSCVENRRDIIEENIDLQVRQNMIYALDQWQLNDAINFEVGLQWHQNDLTDESYVHPRASISWALNNFLTLKTSAGRYDRLPDVGYTLPDIGNPNLKSYLAEHYTFGFEGELLDNWNWSLEAYHKNLSQLPVGIPATDPDASDIYSNDAEGKADGVDIFINRNYANRWYGWVSLSYSQSDRTNKRTQQSFDYTLDTPIVLNIVGNYQLSTLWNAGFRFSAKSGEANTKIIGVKENPNFAGNYLPVYDEPFADRLPYYARLDLRVEREINWFGNEGAFFIDIINALNRKNVSQIDLDYAKVEETGELYLVKDAEMGIFPSVGVSFTF